jgi:CHASE3 domain sensor protein
LTSSPLPDELDTRPEKREWLPMGAFVFVILALVVLAVAPAVLLKRISRETDSVITTILPATDALRELVFAMEERISSARSGSLTGDTMHSSHNTE